MRGIWTEELKELAMAVAKGNPGAFRVIDELMWFSDWHSMMLWCKDNLSGADLWEKYKDVFHQDSHALGQWIQQQMATRQPNSLNKRRGGDEHVSNGVCGWRKGIASAWCVGIQVS